MIHVYETLLCVIDSETVSNAADRLHTTQPTISRQIQQLEAELGIRIFDRVGRRLVLTRAGERVAHYARELVATKTRMLDELNQFTDPERGIIRLGAGLTPTIYRLPQIIARYRLAHPLVGFQIQTASSSETMLRLRAREVDVAIVTTPPVDERDIQMVALWHDELHIVVSPSHRLAGRTVSMEEIAKESLILMPVDSSLRAIVDKHIQTAEQGVRVVRPMIEIDSLEAIGRFVQANQGIALLPTSAVADDIAMNRLADIYPADVDLGSRTITAVVRTGFGMPAATMAFFNALPKLTQAV